MSKFIERFLRLVTGTIMFFAAFSEIAKWATNMETHAPIWLIIFWLFGAVASIARRD